MIATGAIAGMTDRAALKRIQDYYAAVDFERHFEADVERNRDKFVDEQRKLGISPVAAMDVEQLAAAFGANPALLATAQNYWLYTSRHLKLTRALQVQANDLAAWLDRRD